jgi:hypothetical protein
LAALALLALAASACSDGSIDAGTGAATAATPKVATSATPLARAPSTTTTLPPTTTTSPTTTTTATSTTTAAPREIETLIFVGDSVAKQISIAAVERSGDRSGPEVRFLLTWGPTYLGDQLEDLPGLIPDPATTAVVASFGAWQAVPPEGFDRSPGSADPETFKAEVRGFLERLTAPGPVASTTLLLQHSIEVDGVADELTLTNALIEEVASEFGMPVRYMLPGWTLDGEPHTVTLNDQKFPVRRWNDGIHFCAAAALVMADEILDRLAVPGQAADDGDIETIYWFRPENFSLWGCEALEEAYQIFKK